MDSPIPVAFNGTRSRVRPRVNVVVMKFVDGVNLPQQLKMDLVVNRIRAHREDFNVFRLRTLTPIC